MELKNFDEYSSEEQKILLLHWWYYYGKSIFSLAELERFGEIVDEDAQHALDMAVVSYMNNNGSESLIAAMRAERFEELEGIVRNIVASEGYLENKDNLEKMFLTEIVGSLNNCNEEKMRVGISEQRVCEVYRACLFNDNEIKDEIPVYDFSVGEGIREVAVFNTDRLNEHKGEVLDMIEHIENIYLGPHFMQLCVADNGDLWTGDHHMVDRLVQLGVATGILEYTIPREMWQYLPNELPYVCINKEKRNTQIIGEKPSGFVKVISKYKGK